MVSCACLERLCSRSLALVSSCSIPWTLSDMAFCMAPQLAVCCFHYPEFESVSCDEDRGWSSQAVRHGCLDGHTSPVIGTKGPPDSESLLGQWMLRPTQLKCNDHVEHAAT